MIIKHAILHILDKNSGNLIASQGEMNLGQAGLHEYIEKLVNKLMTGDFKPGVLTGDDYLAQVIDDNNGLDFAQKTTQLAEKLFEVIAASEDVPAGDLLSFEFSEGADDFFGLIKLNFAPRFAHIVDYQDDLMVNNLVLNQAVLPGASQRPDEGILVNLMDGSYQLLEKRYLIDGHRINYFSERFLQIAPEESTKDNIKQLKRAVVNIADKYDVPEHEALAATQNVIFESAGEDGVIDVAQVGEAVFKDNLSAKQAYREAVTERELESAIKVENPERVEKKYRMQRFKLDSGIEISIPMDIYQDRSKVEFVNNADGTMSLVIKDIESIINKFTG
jgi:hypothetical protein